MAAEEYLFKNFDEDIFFLYVNAPSVVVGKHQNALAEINPHYIFENNIPVLRRLSGGGAVYHDLGNLNFSFHQTVSDTSKISFKAFNLPVVEVLHQLGVTAEIGPRNDIFVDGFKVSGHAEHVFRNRILSHGTLLFNSNKEILSLALKNNSGKYTGKAIQSVRNKIANITDFLEHQIELEELVELLQKQIIESHSNCKVHQLSNCDRAVIDQLVADKYSTWEWNFGYSPKYHFEKEIMIDDRDFLKVELVVEKGRMVKIEIECNLFSEEKRRAIQTSLLNSPHEIDCIMIVLLTFDTLPLIPSQLLDCFF